MTFTPTVGVTIVREKLDAGDYGARYEIDGKWITDPSVCERKSISDLYASFTGTDYDREKAKWKRAQANGSNYLLAIEGSMSEVLQGHAYWQKGELHQSQKSGIGMLRTLLTVMRKYNVGVWFFNGRKEMALAILEYFLTMERALQNGSIQEWNVSLRSKSRLVERGE